ncbi:phasin family protein [Kordiimonas sp. SCSIO 12610]|uniref:phasin family protein n=1 Tax=Kordiimonas sp. SCSIO 12610 TaxID=2829597 RepID=UPI00210B2D3F|nr:phasin family protein [Kordiimonas sp. SCSIO 12610]UTW54785.1 hypothetical protein KFF44_13375 [Kordiimonas sp. SCSIO 12610]
MAILENIQDSQVVRAYRQGWLAWLGAHKAAFDFAQDGVEKLMSNREKLVEELVQKGENVEELATANFNKVRGNVETRVNGVSEKVSEARNKVFSRTTEEATDRVAELTEEVAKLAKTVSTLSRKVNAAQKPAAKKKAPAKRTPAKKAAAPKAEAPKTETEAKAAA